MARTRAAVGIDVGGTFAKFGLVDASGRLIKEDRLPTQPERGPRDFVARTAKLVTAWRAAGLGVHAAGLAIAGDIDSERGRIRLSPNLRGWDGYPLRDALAKALRAAVVMDNDANLAVWGAFRTQLKGKPQNVVGLTLGTGVGGGIVLGRRLYRGSTGSAGEIGHSCVELGGALCHCGMRGCLEAYAGSYGILRAARAALKERPKDGKILRRLCPDPRQLTPKILSDAANAGDALSRDVLGRTGSYLAAGISNLIMLFNPDAVLILGGVSQAGRWLLDPIEAYMKFQPFKTPVSRARLVLADNPNAGRIGAALLALEETR